MSARALYRAILVNRLHLSRARALHHGCRITETANWLHLSTAKVLSAGSTSGSGVEAPAENFLMGGRGGWAHWVGWKGGGGVATWSLVFRGMRLLLLVPVVPLSGANLAVSPAVGLPFCGNHVPVLYDAVVDFLHKVVVHRRDVAVRGWLSWMLEDDKVHPYRWLKPDLMAPAPFLCCDPGLTSDGCGVISDPDRIDEQFRRVWLPFFCRAGRGAVDLLLLFGRLAAGFLTLERLISLLFWGPFVLCCST